MNLNKKTKTLIIVAGVLLALVSIGAVQYTSQTGFCNSCHEMNDAYAGWATGVHRQQHCYGCHADEGFVETIKVKANGLKEVYLHFTTEVDMDQVHSDVPVDRCLKCHDMTDVDKHGERVAAFHQQHEKFNFDCLSCHATSGHSKVSFNGFKNDACKQCHLPNQT